jgi:polar amino acid transport system permease protein
LSFSQFLSENGPRLLDGALVTLVQFFLAAGVAVSIAAVVGIAKASDRSSLRAVATLYIEFFRGTSLLVQLYWIYFVLPVFGISLDKYVAGFLAVGMNVGGYGAEVVRGAIQAVPRGQWEASYVLSLSKFRQMYRIILPQALLIMLPTWGNLLIATLKGTALVSLISVPDLMFEAKFINDNTFLSAQVFGAALILYYLMARFVITPGVRKIESIMRGKISRT